MLIIQSFTNIYRRTPGGHLQGTPTHYDFALENKFVCWPKAILAIGQLMSATRENARDDLLESMYLSTLHWPIQRYLAESQIEV